MSIREVIMYRVECDADGCTVSPSDGGEHVAWTDHDGALYDLAEAWGWYTGARGHLCPEHVPVCIYDGCKVPIRDDDFGVLCEDHADCPNDCSNGHIECWSPGGPCHRPPPCETCGECRYCRTVADLGSRDRYATSPDR